MKPILLLVLLSFFLSFSSPAQVGKVKENKYRLDLPHYWRKGHKVWKVLADKLPEVCEELKDKDLCGDDCNAKYIVDFYLTEPTVVEYTTRKVIEPVSTNTRNVLARTPSFQPGSFNNNFAYNTFYPTNTSTFDSWQAVANYSFQCFLLLKDNTGKILTQMILVDTNEVWERTYPKNLNTRPMDSDMEYNKEKYNPVIYDLLAIVERKILALKD